jgi:hypothetical protein
MMRDDPLAAALLAVTSARVGCGRDGGKWQRVRLRHAARRRPGLHGDRPDRGDRPVGAGQRACLAHQRAAVELGQGPVARPGRPHPLHAAIRPVTRAPSPCAAVSRPLDRRGNANPVSRGRPYLRGTAGDRARRHRNDVGRHPGRLHRLPLRHPQGVRIALMAPRHCIVGFVLLQRSRLLVHRVPGTRRDP